MSEPLRKAIAIDFDGCLCNYAFPEIGAPHWDVIGRAKKEQQNGAGLILWTCREGDLLQEAIDACIMWGLEFDAVNESLPEWIEAYGNAPRKIGASEYWDDHAVRMPTETATNDYEGHPVDGFRCSACGFYSEEFSRCEQDEETGVTDFYEYEIKYCPECGRKIRKDN